jgi:hypothetical protein
MKNPDSDIFDVNDKHMRPPVDRKNDYSMLMLVFEIT